MKKETTVRSQPDPVDFGLPLSDGEVTLCVNLAGAAALYFLEGLGASNRRERVDKQAVTSWKGSGRKYEFDQALEIRA